ncbi:MAG: BACON domain-containing carbohydrate-binding protein [Acidobacteriota bacterium]
MRLAADLDDDGRVEIVVASHSGTTRVLAAPGQARRSPEWTTFRGGATRDGQPAGSLAVELCFPSIDLALRTAPAGGGDFSVTLSDVEVGCWLDVDTDVDASWFRIDAIEPEIVRYHLEPNTEISQRSVTLLLGGAEHRIVQPPCTLGLSASEIAVSSTGSGHDLDIVTEASCPWSARSDSDWLSVDRGAGSGATSLTLTTSPNDGVARTGRVSVGGAVLVVHQSATGGEADADADGIEDGVDNCPGLANSGQEDVDLNGIGDRCQVDVLVRASSDELENLASLVVALELLDGPALELVEVLLSDTLAGEACAMEHPEANRLDLSCDFADGTGPVLGLLRLVHRHDGTVVDDCGDVVLPALQADFMDGSSSLLDGVELDCQLHSGLAGDVHPSPTGDGRRDLADLVELRRHLTAGTELDTLSRSRVDLHPSRRHCERLPMAADGWESDGDGQVTADDLTVMTELVLGSRVPVVGDCESLPVVEPTERDLPGDLAPAGGDGRVDIADVVETLRVAVGFATLDEADMARVDVSPLTEDLSIIGDGQVNIADVVELLRVAVGMQEVRWPERTIDVTLEWSEAPFVAALVRVDGAPAWAELSAFELAGCPGDTAEDADIADADGTWSRLCVSDPTELTAESAFGTIRYRSREAIDPATLSVEVEMVDRLLLPVGVGLGLVASP